MEASTSQKIRKGVMRSALTMSFCRITDPVSPQPKCVTKPGPPSPVQKVAAAKPVAVAGPARGGEGNGNVDLKAAGYISHVRERFKLERVDSERRRYQQDLA